MNDAQHTKILNAYLSRLPLSDLEMILVTQRAAYAASANYGEPQQRVAHRAANRAIEYSVLRLMTHDKSLIEKVIKENVS